MARRDWVTLTVLRMPSAYSFWASMMTRVEELMLGVEGGMPRSWRKPLTSALPMVGEGRVEVGVVLVCDEVKVWSPWNKTLTWKAD